MNKLLLHAEWTNDCSGKMDYDGEIVSISTRYWRDNTAHCQLLLGSLNHHTIALDDVYIEGETKADVQHQVEVWAQERMDRVVEILRQHFDFERAPSWP